MENEIRWVRQFKCLIHSQFLFFSLQTAPVPFTVSAVVTNSDMSFDKEEIDFGCCTIDESTKTTIKLTNHSILPQEFGFVSHPDVSNRIH